MPTAPDGQTTFVWHSRNEPIEYLKPFIKEEEILDVPSSQLLFTRDITRIVVEANDSCSKDTLSVIVQFQVPEGNTVEVPEPKVKAAAGDSAQYVEAELRPINKGLFQFESMAGATKGNESAFGELYLYKTYSASARILLPHSANYHLILPKTKVNGKEVEFAEVNLNKTIYWSIYRRSVVRDWGARIEMPCTNYQ